MRGGAIAKRSWTGALVGVLYASLLAPACTGARKAAPGEVVAVVTTDMAVPADIDRICVKVTSMTDASPPYAQLYYLTPEDGGNSGIGTMSAPPGEPGATTPDGGLAAADPGMAATDDCSPAAAAAVKADAGVKKVRLPATLALLEPAVVRIEGRLGATTRVSLEEWVTTVPPDGVKMLEMPLEYLCSVGAGVLDGGMASCRDPGTCQGGLCGASPDSVAGTALPDYVPSGGACFNVGACFADVHMWQPVFNDVPQCVIEADASNSGLGNLDVNVALVVNRSLADNQYGFCDSDASLCLIPLDLDSTDTSPTRGTWFASVPDNTGSVDIILPDAVCNDSGNEGEGKPLLGVVTAGRCPAKRPNTCAE